MAGGRALATSDLATSDLATSLPPFVPHVARAAAIADGLTIHTITGVFIMMTFAAACDFAVQPVLAHLLTGGPRFFVCKTQCPLKDSNMTIGISARSEFK